MVEVIDQAVEFRRVRKPVAAAGRRAQKLAEMLQGGGFDFGRGGTGGAELGELAGFAEVQEMTPSLAARGAEGGEMGDVESVEFFEMRRVGEIVGGEVDLLIGGEKRVDARFDFGFFAGEKGCGGFGVFDGAGTRGGAIEEAEDGAEGVLDGGFEAARDLLGGLDEGELEFIAAAVEVADIVDEEIGFLVGEIGVGMENEFGFAEREGGDGGVVADEGEAESVAVVGDGAGEIRDAEDDAVDPLEHDG